MKKRPVWRRTLFRAALLPAVCLLFGGCVYLRLLELKRQFADFDRYFSVADTNGLALTSRNPVLLTEDMDFFGFAPETETRLGAAVLWHLRWTKDYAAAGEKPGEYEVTADFTFVDGKLKRVHVPQSVFAFVPKSLVISALRSLGHASVDQAKASARAALDSAGVPRLTHAEILRFFGVPLDTRREAGRLLMHYRYTTVSTLRPAGKIDFTFTLDATSETVLHLEARMPHVRQLEFDWPRPRTAGAASR